MRPTLPRVHVVTDERVARLPDLEARARAVAMAGPEIALHARGHDLSGLEHYGLARRLAAYPPTPLFVNDRLDVALAVAAQGVQLGARSLTPAHARRLDPDWWIGASVHDLRQAEAAQRGGADYLVVGPVFPTETHAGWPTLGVAGFIQIAALGLPAIAIGGITPARALDLRVAGAYGVAVIRSVWDASDPGAVTQQLLSGVAG